MCPAGSIQSFGLLQEPEACLAVDFQHAGHLLQLALVGRQKLDFEGYRLHPTSPPVCLNYSTAGRINQAAIHPPIKIGGILAGFFVQPEFDLYKSSWLELSIHLWLVLVSLFISTPFLNIQFKTLYCLGKQKSVILFIINHIYNFITLSTQSEKLYTKQSPNPPKTMEE